MNKTKRRDHVKHPGLKKQYNSRIKQEYLDQDYINELSSEEKDWLNDFNEEYYGANLDFQNLENNRFHKTEEEKKACTDRNNARNRCAYGMAKAQNRINDHNFHTIEKEVMNVDLGPDDDKGSDPMIEDVLIDYIDSKKEVT